MSVIDPGGLALTNRYEYYDNPSETGRYTRLKKVVQADGRWVSYDYDAEGRRTLVWRPWKDSPEWTLPEEADATYYNYAPVDARDIPLPKDPRPRVITRKVLGQVVARTYPAFVHEGDRLLHVEEEALTPWASYGEAGNIRTREWYEVNADGTVVGALLEVHRPDLRCEVHQYDRGNYIPGPEGEPGVFELNSNGVFVKETVWHDSVVPYSVLKQGEMNIYNGQGLVVLRQQFVWGPASDRLNWETHEYDDMGNEVRIKYANGLMREREYFAGTRLVERETTPDGQRIRYTYDLQNRVITTTKEGISGGEYPAQPDIVTTYAYDAMGRETMTAVSAADLAEISMREYDAAGRIVSETGKDGLTTRYRYEQQGRRTITIRPGGVEEITERYLDGRAKSVGGTGLVEQRWDYGANADGTLWEKVWYGLGGTNSARWMKRTLDMAGHEIRNERPAIGGAVRMVEHEYDNRGLLTEVRHSVGGNAVEAPTIYQYDLVGRLKRTVVDVNENGQVDRYGPDRIQEVDYGYVKLGEEWWEETIHRTYPWDGSDAFYTTQIERRKMAGGTCGCGEQETMFIDAHGQTTRVVVTVDRTNRKIIRHRWQPDSIQPIAEVSVNGLVQERVSKTGIWTEYRYDALGRQVGVLEARTGLRVTHYDANGRIDYVEDAAGNRTHYAYDEAGRRIAVTDAQSNTVYTVYDEQGRVVGQWGATYPVVYEYDAYGQLAAMYTYRGSEPISSAQALLERKPQMDMTRWHYEEATGLMTNKVYADGRGPSYEYDAAGRLVRRT